MTESTDRPKLYHLPPLAAHEPVMIRAALRVVLVCGLACTVLVMIVLRLAFAAPGDEIAYTFERGYGGPGYGGAPSGSFVGGSNDLFLIDLRTFAQVNLTNSPSVDELNPVWSPDGSRIAYYEQPGAQSGQSICVFDGTKRCYSVPAGVFDLRWSPDSKKIVYLAGSSSLYTIDLDRGDNSFSDLGVNPRFWGWSPDGSHFFVTTNDDYTIGDCCAIYLSDGDPSHLRPVYHGTMMVTSAPGWSPDSRRLVFSAQDNVNESRIYLLDADNSAHLLSYLPGDDPQWSPDGSQIAFISDTGGSLELVLVNPDGSNPQPVADVGQWRELQYTWSPDGSRILFMGDRGGGDQIFIFDLRSKALEPLPSSDGRKTELAWRP